MGYLITITSTEKLDEKALYDAISRMPSRLSEGFFGRPVCDTDISDGSIVISGSFSMSGMFAQEFAKNIAESVASFGHTVSIESDDFKLD